jgi:succinate dehydrogenase/fumarate reductase flavoprotein subunit
VDLLVAGAGAGGMTAALVGALEGVRVVVCEKSSQVGGTSATAAGTVWIPGNTQSRRAGFEDSAEKAQAYLDALLEGPEPRALRAAFLASGPEAMDYLEARSEVKFLPTGRHPDYRELPGAAVSGRGLIPVPFDGRRLGKAFARVRPPIAEFMLLGGMMITKADIAPLLGRFRSLPNFGHAARLVLRYAADRLRYPRGTRLTMGNALVARLYYSLREKGVPVLFHAPIEELVYEHGRVAGARVLQDGRTVQFRARKGVLLATGGYGHNRALRAQFMPQPVPEHSMAHTGNTGDGLVLAEKIGAHIRPQRGGGLWTPASVTCRANGGRGLYPHFLYDRAKPGLIAVNQAGRRFVNEGCSYHDFVEAMYASHKSVPSIPAWLICEASFVAAYGLGAIHPGTRDLSPHEASGYVSRGSSLRELAGKIGIDAAGLEETVARHNEFAAKGTDLDFGKGGTELNRFNGDESLPGNPCLKPIQQPPFVAMAVWPADISVCTGLATNEDARVLDAAGKPIAGLYACGNDMASVFAGHYPGPGTTLGPAMTFAYRAALHAARTPP